VDFLILLIISGWFQRLIGVQDEDSCGRSGQCETSQAKPRRLTGHPRNAKSCTEIISGDKKLKKLYLLHNNLLCYNVPIFSLMAMSAHQEGTKVRIVEER
jgi:hypothetical protein